MEFSLNSTKIQFSKFDKINDARIERWCLFLVSWWSVVTLRTATHEVASSNKTILCNLFFVAELIQRSHFEKLNYADHCQFEPQMDVWSRVIWQLRTLIGTTTKESIMTQILVTNKLFVVRRLANICNGKFHWYHWEINIWKERKLISFGH